MKSERLSARSVLSCIALLLLLASASRAGATTLIRSGIDDLARDNQLVVVGEVIEVHSYWNRGGTFILSDVRIAASEVAKGSVDGNELVITILGGTIDDLATLIVAGAELVPGRSYVLFLNPEDLPGSPGVLTVRDHAQGVFEIFETAEGPRAISQAVEHPLLPDASGLIEPPGGRDGLSLDSLVDQIKGSAEVNR